MKAAEELRACSFGAWWMESSRLLGRGEEALTPLAADDGNETVSATY